MADRVDLHPVSKRFFLKSCALGVLSAGTGLDGVVALAKSVSADRSVRSQESFPARWMKEALFYHVSGRDVVCEKCPHMCALGPGEAGICRSRVNRDGKLYSIAYGNPCAVHVDPIEKKPFFHFLPGARALSIAVAGCNLRCLNCQNWEISQVSPRESYNYDLPPERVVDECAAGKFESIAYTYSEPTTFYEYMIDTAASARQRGIKNLLKSNGYINEAPLRKLCKVIDAANIDLKSFDDSVYQRLSSAHRDPVLRTLKVLHEEGVWLEVTNLVVPAWSDGSDTIRRMCDWLVENGLSEYPVHFSRFTPLYKLTQLPATPLSKLEEAYSIAQRAGLKYVYLGNVPGHRTENTFCPGCKKLIIERRGFVVSKREMVKGNCRFCGQKISGVWS